MRLNKPLSTIVRRWRGLFNAHACKSMQTSGAELHPNNQASLDVMPLEELESRTLLSASPFTPDTYTDDPPVVIQAGLLAADPEDSLIAGDLDSDGFVGINDLNIVLGAWNQSVPPGNPAADISGDGFVGIDDLNEILSNWNNNAIVDLSSGTTLTGAIINTSDIDTFTVDAAIGEDLLMTIGNNTGSSFELEVSLYDPTGDLIKTVSGDGGFRVDAMNLAETGTYTYVVSERDGTSTGSYTITTVVQDEALDNDNVTLNSGETFSGSITNGDIDTFTIDATIGEELFMTIGNNTGSSFELEVSLYDPTGDLVRVIAADGGFRLNAPSLAETGTYTYVVRENEGSSTGNYSITAVVLDEVIDNDNVTLLSGQTEAGSITSGDIDTFTIDAAIGEDLLLTIGNNTGSSFELEVSLYDPTGDHIKTLTADGGFRLDALNLAETGTYTYIVRENEGSSSGNYSITAVIQDEAIDNDNVTLVSGETLPGSINSGDIDTFTIDAAIGEELLLTIGNNTGSSFELEVSLYDPTGDLIKVVTGDGGFRLDAPSLAETGTYTYVVRERQGSSTGNYAITAVVLDEVIDNDNVALVSGNTLPGSINSGDIDTYTIDAALGTDLLLAIANNTGSSFELEVSLYDPTGDLIDIVSGDGALTLDLLNITEAGTYTYVVREREGSSNGNYSITATVTS